MMDGGGVTEAATRAIAIAENNVANNSLLSNFPSVKSLRLHFLVNAIAMLLLVTASAVTP